MALSEAAPAMLVAGNIQAARKIKAPRRASGHGRLGVQHLWQGVLSSLVWQRLLKVHVLVSSHVLVTSHVFVSSHVLVACCSEMLAAGLLNEGNAKTRAMARFGPGESPRSVQLYGVEVDEVRCPIAVSYKVKASRNWHGVHQPSMFVVHS